MEYVGLVEAAEILGITKQNLTNVRHRDPQFPQPLAQLRMGPVWKTEQIKEYKRARRKI